MAEPGVINNLSAVDEVKRIAKDLNGAWFGSDTARVFTGFLLDHMEIGDEETITLTKKGPLYLPPADYSKSCLIASDDPVFTAEDDVTYTFYARGIRVHVTDGSPTATTISVKGFRCNFYQAAADLYEWLAAHMSQVISESVGGTNTNADQVAARCRATAAHLRGPMGI